MDRSSLWISAIFDEALIPWRFPVSNLRPQATRPMPLTRHFPKALVLGVFLSLPNAVAAQEPEADTGVDDKAVR